VTIVSESRTQDDEHLRLLSIFHYVVAGLTALVGCFPLIHVTIGLIIAFAPETFNDNKGEPAPAWIGLIFAGIGGAVIAMFWSLAACIAFAGRFLARRKCYMFCLVIAAIECMFAPFGTVLGVFTIIVLVRDSVKQSFAAVAPNIVANAGGPVV
jgi:hypothetical protein